MQFSLTATIGGEVGALVYQRLQVQCYCLLDAEQVLEVLPGGGGRTTPNRFGVLGHSEGDLE